LKELAYQDILVKKCQKGDSKAQYQLFQLCAKQMFNIAFRILGNTFEAEDAVQEGFIKAFQKIGSFNGDATFGAWLKRIIVNHSISEIRKKKYSFKPIGDFEEQNVIMEQEINLDEKISIQIVQKAIESLPEGARVVFTLKAIEEYKFSEISEMLDLSISNCKVQYHRSKKLLKEKLECLID